MTDSILLIGDIGGTNARFGLADPNSIGYSKELVLSCSNYATVREAMTHYLETIGASAPAIICLAAAGPIVDQEVRFTNNPWIVSAPELRDVFGARSVQLLNDFEAVAHCVPFLTDANLLRIGTVPAQSLGGDNHTIGVLGPGTGMGAVGLRMVSGNLITIVSEAGHIGFAPETERQVALLQMLRERFDRVSVERLVSGPGLENLYWALCRVAGEKFNSLSAADIFSASKAGANRIAREAVESFFEILGQVAGDLALTLGAADGIFIAGGVAQRYPDNLLNSRFRRGFERKGRHTSIMQSIPTQLITHEQPGLLGAAYRASQLASSLC